MHSRGREPQNAWEQTAQLNCVILLLLLLSNFFSVFIRALVYCLSLSLSFLHGTTFFFFFFFLNFSFFGAKKGNRAN